MVECFADRAGIDSGPQFTGTKESIEFEIPFLSVANQLQIYFHWFARGLGTCATELGRTGCPLGNPRGGVCERGANL